MSVLTLSSQTPVTISNPLQWPGRASTLTLGDPEIAHCLDWSAHASYFKFGTVVATLSGAWCYKVGDRTGWLDVSIL